MPSNRQSEDWNLCQHYNNECLYHEPLYGKHDHERIKVGKYEESLETLNNPPHIN